MNHTRIKAVVFLFFLLVSHLLTTLPCKAFPFFYSFIKIAPSHPKPSADQIKGRTWQHNTICPEPKENPLQEPKIHNSIIKKERRKADLSVLSWLNNARSGMRWSNLVLGPSRVQTFSKGRDREVSIKLTKSFNVFSENTKRSLRFTNDLLKIFYRTLFTVVLNWV